MTGTLGTFPINVKPAGAGRFVAGVGSLLLLIYVGSGTFSVSQNQLGVLQRFGKVIDSAIPPGIHYAFPWPVDKVSKVPVREIRRISIMVFTEQAEARYGASDTRGPARGRDVSASRTASAAVTDLENDGLEYVVVSDTGGPDYTFPELTGLEPYCISGDNNIMNISFVIQYRISDPARYLFVAEQPEDILHDVACSAMVHTLTRMPVDLILTTGKSEIESNVRHAIGERLGCLNYGVGVTYVELMDVSPPAKVQEQFDDVVNAKIDRERLINEAESYRNSRIPDANGNARRTIEQAWAYRGKVTAEAEGDARRFLGQLAAYRGAEARTRKRLWLEFVAECLPKMERSYVLSSEDGRPPVRLRIRTKR